MLQKCENWNFKTSNAALCILKIKLLSTILLLNTFRVFCWILCTPRCPGAKPSDAFPPRNHHHLRSACTLKSSDSPESHQMMRKLEKQMASLWRLIHIWWFRLKCAPAWLHLSQPNQLGWPALRPQWPWRDSNPWKFRSTDAVITELLFFLLLLPGDPAFRSSGENRGP